ncbi:hypothetical protein R1flu_013289 [Riccia fluitans]|uniref:Uncharacterized protein n=1 Tax=Riccia fluitans TaxID=41844 RepID=A0ABD1YCZ4_9MARC
MAQVKGQAKEKEPHPSTSTVYLAVVEDVIQNVRADFQSEGVDENVLNELQALWELKLMQAGAVEAPVTEAAPAAPAKGTTGPVTPVTDLNVPYEATEEYQTPTVEMLFPPTPQTLPPQTPQTPFVMTPTPQPDAMTPQVMTPLMDIPSPALTSTGEQIMYQYMPAGPSDNGSGGNGLDLDTKLGRPQPYMQHPSPWMNKPRGVDVNLDMNATYEEGQEDDEYEQEEAPVTKDFFTLSTGKRKREEIAGGPYIQGYNMPQTDGAHQACPFNDQAASYIAKWASEKAGGRNPVTEILSEELAAEKDVNVQTIVRTSSSKCLPQRDGIDDDYDDGVAEEDYNEPGEEEPQPANEAATPKIAKVELVTGDSDGEPPLNEDDDDDLDDNDQGDEEPETEHLVLAQFEKVTRSKNKWKCTLRDGIMHLHGRDILFLKATGEFEF